MGVSVRVLLLLVTKFEDDDKTFAAPDDDVGLLAFALPPVTKG